MRAWKERHLAVYLPAFSGHGSSYRFDSHDEPHMTLEKAWEQVLRWESYGCTIGGSGCVVHMPTMALSRVKPSETSFVWKAEMDPQEEKSFIKITHIG